MYYDYFSKTTQKRGKQYFEQNRVFSLEGKDNRYSALILGMQPYHTTLTLNAKGNIVQASCDCPYAQDGYRCKHEAALYFALEERLLQNNSQFFDVKHVFKKYRRTTYNDYMLHNRFMKEFNEYIKIITAFDKKNQLDITNFQKVIDDLIDLAYPGVYKRKLLEKAFHTYTKLNMYYKETVKWLDQCFISENHLIYKEYFLEILYLLEVKDQIHILKNALLKRKDNELFDDYIDIVEKYNLNIKSCLNKLQQYENLDIYNYEIIKDLVKNQQIEEAKNIYQKLLKNKRIKNKFYQTQMESMVIKEKENSFFKYMLARCDYFNYEMVVFYYHELENFYGDKWQKYNDQFIQNMKQKCDRNDYYYILIITKNVKAFICDLIDNPDFDIFKNYKNHIKEYDKESYMFLYVDCMLDKVQYIKSSREYDELIYDIRTLFDDINDQLVKHEIAQLFIEKYPKRKKIKEIFDRYLSLEGEKNEIRY